MVQLRLRSQVLGKLAKQEKSGGPRVSGSRLLTIRLFHATPTLEVTHW
jgi:hypothetical protein